MTTHAWIAAYFVAGAIGSIFAFACLQASARDNPLDNTPRDLGEGQGKGMGLGVHAVANNSKLERNND